MSRVTCLAIVLVLLAGCAQRQAPTPEPDPDQAVAPTVTDADPVPLVEAAPTVEPTPSAAATPPADDGGTTTPEAGTASPPGGSAQPPPRSEQDQAPRPRSEPVVLLSVGDRSGDHGPEGPPWTDLTAVELVELGNDLRVTLQFAGPLPSPPAEGEVPLIGVDIGDGDANYQLFVEGGGQSWEAYLYTPQGFVRYPGTFRLGGRSMVLQVPFNAIGSPTRAPVRVFVRWSQERLLLNATSEDRLDGEPHTFDRAP